MEKAKEKVEGLKGGEKEKKNLIDINSASLEELRSLNGIGETRAKNIVKNRLYARKDELVQKNIVPPLTGRRYCTPTFTLFPGDPVTASTRVAA